jgi:hypothetical protein
MVPILIHYSVDEDESATNVKYIMNYFHQLNEFDVPGIRHSVYKMGKANFVHVCHYPTNASCEAATGLPAFKQFVKKLETIIEQEPVVNNVEEIGRYCG